MSLTRLSATAFAKTPHVAKQSTPLCSTEREKTLSARDLRNLHTSTVAILSDTVQDLARLEIFRGDGNTLRVQTFVRVT